MSKTYELVNPFADAIVESLRAVGYSLETAISDIIDNSISAGAKKIQLTFFWDVEHSYIRIEDNGRGMTREELVEAMRLGTRNPLQSRSERDLGRFGLGLKTASFSQCRRLTVKSKTCSTINNTRCWDLDFIQLERSWALLDETFNEQSEERLATTMNNEAGTIILWENMDKVLGEKINNKSHDNFLKKIERTEKHISMVFHRFLKGAHAINIFINGNKIVPWDPYMTDEMTTIEFPEQSYSDGKGIITIKPYLLPHHSKLTKKAYILGEGTKGWNEMQGFYIYRNQRLLVAGDWLGLFKKDESCKLARIIVDIPNNLDVAWDIDIKKASARPPDFIIDELALIGRRVREASTKVYYHRGTTVQKRLNQEVISTWKQVQQHGNISFRVNRDHPIVSSLFKNNTQVKKEVEALLSLIEETIPIDLISSHSISNHQQVRDEKIKLDEIRYVLSEVIVALKEGGLGDEAIRNQVSRMDPFNKYPEIIAMLI
ncbi:ATP-binding protein [Cohnella sp. WQ 127256]|uniref:ATP-binding protein n=1 Tax=Cohnella sp. WQ 127256 TaxID=2938790 RepID=UPI002118D3DC|nr:ATP-binding protein [Cohnella sp. WQ 127256]